MWSRSSAPRCGSSRASSSASARCARSTQSLVKFQRDFLDKGLPYLRPLALRDVGEDIGMHESTISRVTTNKYVQTPQGLFELKYFFHSGIASGQRRDGLLGVGEEDDPATWWPTRTRPSRSPTRRSPRSLQGQGLTIARRTVAKYREELGILPSHQRRLHVQEALRPRSGAGDHQHPRDDRLQDATRTSSPASSPSSSRCCPRLIEARADPLARRSTAAPRPSPCCARSPRLPQPARPPPTWPSRWTGAVARAPPPGARDEEAPPPPPGPPVSPA